LKTTVAAGTSMTLSKSALAAALEPQSRNTAHHTATEDTSFTRGIGMYPGAPEENFAPSLMPDLSGSYRNLALLRPAFHSSAYDYNLTAQLVTDGLIDTQIPTWVTTVVNGQILPKESREQVINHFGSDAIEIPGPQPSLEIHLGGGTTVPEIDRVDLFAIVPDSAHPGDLTFTLLTSADGHTWRQSATVKGPKPEPQDNYSPDLAQGNHLLAVSLPLDQPSTARYYRLEFAAKDGRKTGHNFWRIGGVGFYRGQQRVEIGGPYAFTSAWKSEGIDEEWVYVDLGTSCTFDKVTLHWIARASEGKVQVSDNAEHWRDIATLPGEGAVDELKITPAARGRYVRVLMTRPATPQGYILSEMQVFGRGGFILHPKPAPQEADGQLDLSGGRWRLQRAGSETGEALSAAGFHDTDWLIATVPGTTLTSYLNAGAIPDPNFGQNQLHISDSFFYSDFWYRTEFASPSINNGEIAWLNFDGINWKADVYLNGEKLGRIEGGFMRGHFDITAKLHRDKPNALAVRVLKNATPGSCKQKTWKTTGLNGGALGADNPTYHASIGWDWIPTIRGRNTGIWGGVSLTTTGAVTLENPLVTSTLPLPATNSADVSLEVFAVNHTAQPVTGILHARFGDLTFEHPLTLAANTSQTIKLSPATHPQLRIVNPQLWWPTGYGEPHLYDGELRFEANGSTHHRTQFKAGIRQMTSNEDGGNLRLFINGRRFIARGGNWGFGESMLRYRAREYDVAVRYHREMNFTMIRNWVGQIGDEAFYEACDRHGIVVWHDFWLANPWDGPIPDDNALFLANARDFILRIRSHASLGLYCGRNEGFPPAPLEKGLRALLAELHPDIKYIGSSADGPVSGHGPYRALEPKFYFQNADPKLHSELGAPNIPPFDSLRRMMPESGQWPQGLDWGLHDFTLEGAQGGTTFLSMIADGYGGATNAKDWCTLAQFVNYDTYRAMFEAQSKYRMGLLLWMSHPCWPSFVWQTYDYYFEPTSAYFACKKASEPLHIQWNSFADTVEVVNYNAGNMHGLTAQLEIFNLDGKRAFEKSATLDAAEDSVTTILRVQYPTGLSAVHFLRLTLTQNGKSISTNFYHRGLEYGSFLALRSLKNARLRSQTTTEHREGRWLLTTKIENTSAWPALMVRLKAVRSTAGDSILPAIYDDNYFPLMPGETRTIVTELSHADTRGQSPAIVIEGFNTARA
jgi:hypothetical protein